MLDKSVPYKNIIMKLPAADACGIREPVLPDGFSLRLFADGDEYGWAAIETSVLEFPDEENALEYFTSRFLIHRELLKKRCVFVVAPDGKLVATATAWYSDGESVGLGRQATLHWVAVRPEYQGLGLGKAVVQKALSLFPKVEPGLDIYLHTQTWSHVAVTLYHRVGFNMTKNGKLAGLSRVGGARIYDNDYDEAMEILKGVVSEETYKSLIANAL